jgi:cytochrome c556
MAVGSTANFLSLGVSSAMLMRNTRVLFASAIAVALMAGSLSFAADGEGKLHEAMEKVGKVNNAINKSVRTPVAYKKDSKGVTDNSKELVKLAKETVEALEDAKKIKGVKDAEAQWKTLAADFLKVSEKLAEAAAKEDHAAVKDAHSAVKKSCTACHDVFRIEE